jgi:hypothetical protein
MRVRARLESPTDGAYPAEPRPGWCSWFGDSLGSAAGKGREIAIYARTDSPPFESFEFSSSGVAVYRQRDFSSTAANAARFTLDAVNAIWGTHLANGQRRQGDNMVYVYVRRIDSRWGVEGEPAFITVE